MLRGIRMSAIILIFGCLLGAAFFVFTDPRTGLVKAGRDQNVVDLFAWHNVGTVVGLSGCAILLALGLFLFSKKAA